MSKRVLTAVGFCLFAPVVSAQDLLAVGWSGNAYTLDSSSGAQVALGPTGFANVNAMASSLGVHVASSSPGPGLPDELFLLDAATGAGALLVVADVSGIRGMAAAQDGTLYACAPPSNGIGRDLYTIDLVTGAGTLIGPTANGLQALEFGLDGKLYGWDTSGPGLVAIDPATGVATDVNPSIGGGFDVQSLVADGCGLLGGNDKLFLFDTATGGGSALAGGLNDLRALARLVPLGGVTATETVRLGSPPNPDAFLPGRTSGPVVGATWDPVLDHTSFHPAAVADFVAISSGPANIPLPIGTLLCQPPAPELTFSSPPGVPFALAVPQSCSLIGLNASAQGAAIDAVGGLLLANALDVVFGTR